MSCIYIDRVLNKSVTTGASRLLMLVIAARADDNGVAQISHRQLSADTKMSVRSIRRLLFTENSPIPAGELELYPGGNDRGRKRRITQYRITL